MRKSKQLQFEQFERVFRNQIHLFVQRQLSNTLTLGLGSDYEVIIYTFTTISPHTFCIVTQREKRLFSYAQMTQLSTIKAMFHNGARLSARFDAIEARQASTEALSKEISNVLKCIDISLGSSLPGYKEAQIMVSEQNSRTIRKQKVVTAEPDDEANQPTLTSKLEFCNKRQQKHYPDGGCISSNKIQNCSTPEDYRVDLKESSERIQIRSLGCDPPSHSPIDLVPVVQISHDEHEQKEDLPCKLESQDCTDLKEQMLALPITWLAVYPPGDHMMLIYLFWTPK
jgi:hypothetical protein